MLLLSPAQFFEIRQIIQDHHDAFVVAVTGEGGVPPEILEGLKKKGLISGELDSISQAYLYGQVMAMLQNPMVASMDYDAFKDFVESHPVLLSLAERHAVDMAILNAAQYIKGLGNTVSVVTGNLMIEADKELQAKLKGEVRTKTEENIEKRETLKQLKSELGWATRDWARDWTRIAVTEKHNAMQQGIADHYRKTYGTNSLVAKRCMPDACKHCKRLHIGPDGQPRIFKLSQLTENGTNFGRKAAEYLPVVGVVHPQCQCQMVRIPGGWGFDGAGNLVPGGAFGVRYEGESDLELAMREEDELQKSLSQKHTTFEGLSICIENKAGTKRKCQDADGNTIEIEMAVSYGFIEGTLGYDNEEIDVFIGPDPRAENVFVIEQQDPDTGFYDEQKVMLGFPNQELAESIYRMHYGAPDDYELYTTPMPLDHFIRWVSETVPQEGEDLEPVLTGDEPRLVIPVEKAMAPALDSWIGAATGMAGHRSPSPGTSANYVFGFPRKTPFPNRIVQTAYTPDAKKMLEEGGNIIETAHGALKRDKKTFTVEEMHPGPLHPVVVPEDYYHGLNDRPGIAQRRRMVAQRYRKNIGLVADTMRIPNLPPTGKSGKDGK